MADLAIPHLSFRKSDRATGRLQQRPWILVDEPVPCRRLGQGDGIAIALRLGAPIFAAESLLIEPGEETADEEGDEPEFGGDEAPAGEGELTSEQLKAYLENLRPEDFGKFNP